MHECLFLLLACRVQLAMPLIYVVLDLTEFLHSPLAHIHESLHLLASVRVQPCQRALQLFTELRVVSSDKVHHIDYLLKT